MVKGICLGPEGSKALVKQSLLGRVLGQGPLSTSTMAGIELATDQGLKPTAVINLFLLSLLFINDHSRLLEDLYHSNRYRVP